jgi:hypothetical protein
MVGNVDPVRGGVVSQEEKAEFDSLRAVFDPKSAIDRLDSYGKWLFASATIVGSLGAGLSNSAFSKLRGAGLWLDATAIVALGLCLFAASRSIAPHWIEARLYDVDSLRTAVNNQFKSRRRQLAWATLLFAFALVMAALSPLVSLLTGKSYPVVHYSVDEKGALEAGLEVNALAPGTTVQLSLEGPKESTVQFPHAGTTADENGQVKLSLRIANFGALPAGTDLIGCSGKRGEVCVERLRVRVKH